MADETEYEREEPNRPPRNDLYRAFRPAFDVSRMFPDYSKMFAAMTPDYSKLLASAIPDLSGLAASMATPDFTRMLRAAAIDPNLARLIAPNLSELLPRLDVRVLFPDYSRMFPRIDTRQLFSAYEAALPRAVQAAEEYVVEEVAAEVEAEVAAEGVPASYVPPKGREAAEWISQLPPAKKREFATKLATAVGTILGVALAAFNGDLPYVAGALLAYATALYSIYAFVITEDERRAAESE